MTPAPDHHVKSVARAFDIVEALKEFDGAGVSELADRTGIPPSTVFNYLATLREREYVVQEGQEYALANRFIHLGDYAKNRHDLVDVARREIGPLVDETGETVNIMVEENGLGIYAHSRTAATGLTNFAHTRKREHLHSTAAGKAILANLPDDRVDEILEEREIPRQTTATITDEAELRAELDEVRESGVSFNDEENTPGIRAVGAPIRTGDGVAAVSVAGPINRFDDDTFRNTLPRLVSNTAKSIEVDLIS